MDRNKSYNYNLQQYANQNSLRINKYQEELINYTMKFGIKCKF